MKSKREEIINTADQLFYENGYENTSFADIAAVVKISRGNFYHHFKTKDEILNAVIEYRISKTQKMLNAWQINGENPRERIVSFIHILITNQAKIKLYGCPVGTLVSELSKLDHSSKPEANKLFNLFSNYLSRQFVELGFREKANECALHLLMRSQGVAVLANAFRNEDFVNNEVRLMTVWLDNIIKEREICL